MPPFDTIRFTDKFKVCKFVKCFKHSSLIMPFSLRFNPIKLGAKRRTISFEMEVFFAKLKQDKFL